MVQGFGRKTGWAAALAAGALGAAAPAYAQAGSPEKAGLYDAAYRSAISGVVRDRAGHPQAGALVELLNAQYAVLARTWTDERGRYSLPRLGAGLYQVRATAELLLPAMRPSLHLAANTRAVVNLTLASVYAALDWLPAEPRQPGAPSDDWDWTLRLATNRPLLRLLPGGPVLVEAPAANSLRARAVSGRRRFGEGGAEQQIRWNAGRENGQAVTLGAAAGPGRLGAEAGFAQELADGRSLAVLAGYKERPNIRSGTAAGLQVTRVRSSSTVRAAGLLELTAGADLEAVRLGGGPLSAGEQPFVDLRAHAGDGFVEYRAATSVSSGEDAPRLAMEGGRLRLERGLHQELRAGRKAGSWTGEAALFYDRLANPVVEGGVRGGFASFRGSDVLFDPQTGTIAVSGLGYTRGGVLAMLRDQLSPDTWISFRFALGEALALPSGTAGFAAEAAPAASVAAGTRIPGAGTVVQGSYRWQPESTLTAVAPFESGAPDAYLGLSVRQPLRRKCAGGGDVQAVLDVGNLLAEGYRPFLLQDGMTVFFAQAQRTVSGGLSFSF